MTRTNWTELVFYGVLIAVATVGAFVIAVVLYVGGMEIEEAVTVSFLTLAFAQLWHVFDVRDVTSGIVRTEVTENAYVWEALGLSTLILVGPVYLPVVSLALSAVPIGFDGSLVVLGTSLLPLVVVGVRTAVPRRWRPNRRRPGVTSPAGNDTT